MNRRWWRPCGRTCITTMAQWSWLFGGWSDSDDAEEGSTTGVVGSLLLIFLAPIAASLIQLALSRAREYGADAAGAHVAGDAHALASALRKLALETPSARRPSTRPRHICILLTRCMAAALPACSVRTRRSSSASH